MNFEELVKSIRDVDSALVAQATKAINISLTMRNWFIGNYIAEYELNGMDRAEYGARILETLANKLEDISSCSKRYLYKYLRFYRLYPQIVRSASPQLVGLLPDSLVKRKLPIEAYQIDSAEIVRSETALFGAGMLEKLSFSHFERLIEIEDETKRLFYQVECLRGGWSVKELRRQIGSLYYERSGLSLNKKELSNLVNSTAEKMANSHTIRDPYVFEFLGLKLKEVMSESHLQDQLLNKLEDFILELGHGFCYEAKGKRILIGDEYCFIDMVFYHRILKCHVLIELKVENFSHESIGQLNTYVSWYRKNMMTEGDNPPIGILLCTGKNEALVEYALAGMDNNLFVSKYLLELPKKEEMQAFIEKQVRELETELNLNE